MKFPSPYSGIKLRGQHNLEKGHKKNPLISVIKGFFAGVS
jgi:hypothetical protein